MYCFYFSFVNLVQENVSIQAYGHTEKLIFCVNATERVNLFRQKQYILTKNLMWKK